MDKKKMQEFHLFFKISLIDLTSQLLANQVSMCNWSNRMPQLKVISHLTEINIAM